MSNADLIREAEKIQKTWSEWNGFVAAPAAADLIGRLVKALKMERPANPPALPDGWAAVPRELTFAMIKAGGHANSEWLNANAPIGEARYAMPMKSVWAAMLVAAPPAPEKEG